MDVIYLYARCRYIAYRLYLRLKMGADKRDKYLQRYRIAIQDFIPEMPYKQKGIKAVPRKKSDDYLFLYGHAEWRIVDAIKLRAGEVFLDIGSNVGYFTLQIARDSNVRVISIEAVPETYHALCRNIKLNRFKNVIAMNCVVSDYKGTISMRTYHDGYGRSLGAISSLENNYAGEIMASTITVPCDTLDNIIQSIGIDRIDVAKIDIEGAELLALQGASRTLKQLRKIIIEIHGTPARSLESNLKEIKTILLSNNFSLDVMPVPQSGIPEQYYVFATK